MSTFLDQILSDAAHELSSTKARRPTHEIHRMLMDVPPPQDFYTVLASSFGLIAEIKKRSPSVGPMREENVADAPSAYEESPIVRALSILTNAHYFGMDIECLSQIRRKVTKPILRKDFIVDEYQVREARAFGADAILLMANTLDAARLSGFYDLARELSMEAIFEVHTAEEIALLPPAARIIGINSRKFKTTKGFVGPTESSARDFSVSYEAFDLANELPTNALHVAESGISPDSFALLRDRFDAVLVGTSLLRDPAGIRSCLCAFETALATASNGKLEK